MPGQDLPQLAVEPVDVLEQRAAAGRLGDGREAHDVADHHDHVQHRDLPEGRRLPDRVQPVAFGRRGEPSGPELQFRGAQANPVAGHDPDRYGSLDPLPVEPGAVGAEVGQPGLVQTEIQPQFQVHPGDGRLVDQQPVPLVDAETVPADEQPVVDRH